MVLKKWHQCCNSLNRAVVVLGDVQVAAHAPHAGDTHAYVGETIVTTE